SGGARAAPGPIVVLRGARRPAHQAQCAVASMRTRELLKLHNAGHPRINSLFAKAHSADWDFEKDVDWRVPVERDDPLVHHGWAAYGRTPTFQALPEPVKVYATRRALGRLLNILQVGESVAQNVCAKLVLVLREEDYRNHAS